MSHREGCSVGDAGSGRKIIVESAVEAKDEERKMLQVNKAGGVVGSCRSVQVNDGSRAAAR